MDSIAGFLTHDHHRVDGYFAAARQAIASRRWDEARQHLAEFGRALEEHVRIEEEILFPAFEARSEGVGGPTQTMRMEHREMRRLLETMAAAVQGRDARRARDLAQTLLALLQAHDLKEQHALCPMAGEIPAAEQETLLRRIAALREAAAAAG